MGRNSLQSNSVSVTQSRKKRSFSLPRFRKSSAGEQQEEAESAEEAARVQKAAAWQWYTRGVGEAVIPTKRPAPVAKSPPSPSNSNVLHKKLLEPALAESLRTASRFKAEALLARPPSAGKLQPTPSAPSAAPNSTPLYDELELSGLRTQMADLVQRLQQTQLRSPAQKAKPSFHVAVDGRPLPAAASVSTKAEPPPAAAAISSDHQLTRPPPSAAPVVSTIPFHMRPFSALNSLFRKVVSGSILKSTKNSPLMTPPVYIHEPEVLNPEDQHHFHHYIHHHHHHYHGENPEESATITPSRRRHTYSSSIRPQLASLLEAESDEEEEEAERSAIEAYLSGRRRHSDSFAAHLNPRKAAFDEVEEMKVEESAMAASDQRRYNSERFTPNKIPTMLGEVLAEPATDKCDEGFPDVRSRRLRSAENERELGASLERKPGGGGKSGGGTYKLGGGKSGGGTYKLGGGAAGGATAAIKPVVRRRHSEGLQRPEGHCASPGRAYQRCPSSRYLEDVLQSQVGAFGPANANNAARPPRPNLKQKKKNVEFLIIKAQESIKCLGLMRPWRYISNVSGLNFKWVKFYALCRKLLLNEITHYMCHIYHVYLNNHVKHLN